MTTLLYNFRQLYYVMCSCKLSAIYICRFYWLMCNNKINSHIKTRTGPKFPGWIFLAGWWKLKAMENIFVINYRLNCESF
jgi:hypothetical protein